MSEFWRPYGQAFSVRFPLIDRGTLDFESTPVTFAAGDAQRSLDGGAFANATNLPTHIGLGNYEWDGAAAEAEADDIWMHLIDQSNPKLWEDQAIHVYTQLAGWLRSRLARNGDANRIRLDSAASATSNLYRYCVVEIIAGTGAGQGGRLITAYDGATGWADIRPAWVTAPSSTSTFVLRSFALASEISKLLTPK